MADEGIFVGRDPELEQFDEVLRSPEGQAVLVVGQAGMGKTMLVNKMAACATHHPDLKCGFVRYEVTPTDSVDTIMALMIDHAFQAAQLQERSFDATPQGVAQWKALLNVVKIGDLVMSLRRDVQRNTRDQFIERLELISGRLPEGARAIFIIDADKYMQPGSQDSWRIVVRQLHPKIKFLFAQRPEDVLASSREFSALTNVVRIPQSHLDVLDAQAVDTLLDMRAPDLAHPVDELRAGIAHYQGHAYAVQGALDLIQAGVAIPDLPHDPTGIAAAQWEKVTEISPDAIRLFKAYAILEVSVPDSVAEAVSTLDPDTGQHLLANRYLRGLIRQETDGSRIYHTMLSDHIRRQISDEEATDFHQRAVEEYRHRLKAAKRPDELAARRLPVHTLACKGPEAFVKVLVTECTGPLRTLGLLETAIDFSHMALKRVSPGSVEEAALLGNLGIIYQTRGDLDQAEQMLRKSLEIEEKLGRIQGMAIDYGNLGLIYKTRGDLDQAEQMLRKALELHERLGHLEGMAARYGNLGLIYKTRGDLDQAEQMHCKALELHKRLGCLEGMASDCGNLGLIYQTRGDLDQAEQMLRKALELDERLGHLEGIATAYGNLGLIYQTRGDLDQAEQMLRKALELHERLGHLEGIAKQYGNLGLIYRSRGDLDQAEQMARKALELNERLGRLEGMANAYGNLGVIYQTRGDLGQAERMLRKALELDERLGRLEGMATEYGNLGIIYQTRGDLGQAERMFRKALELDERLRHLEGMARDYGNLGLIYETRGDINGAREYWTKARDLFAKIGMPHMIEKIQGWLDGLPDSDEQD